MAQEPPPADLEELRARLEEVEAKLARAGLILPADPEGFEITDRGRRMLDEHPDGIDESLLVGFPEYRSAVAERSVSGSPAPSAAAYDAGYAAWLAGRALSDNPHPADRRDHLDWQNGWSQARDDGLKSDGGRSRS